MSKKKKPDRLKSLRKQLDTFTGQELIVDSPKWAKYQKTLKEYNAVMGDTLKNRAIAQAQQTQRALKGWEKTNPHALATFKIVNQLVKTI